MIMKNDRSIILVSGATGKQGGAVARELLSHGYKVRAMTRKPADPAARELAGLGADIVKADLDQPETLDDALAGVWGVFAVQNTWEAGVEREEQGNASPRSRTSGGAFCVQLRRFTHRRPGSLISTTRPASRKRCGGWVSRPT
jgi:uncharacterized protein YbjT (DUF2867 family)